MKSLKTEISIKVQHTLPEPWRKCLIINFLYHEALDVLLMPLSIKNNINSAKQIKFMFVLVDIKFHILQCKKVSTVDPAQIIG